MNWGSWYKIGSRGGIVVPVHSTRFWFPPRPLARKVIKTRSCRILNFHYPCHAFARYCSLLAVQQPHYRLHHSGSHLMISGTVNAAVRTWTRSSSRSPASISSTNQFWNATARLCSAGHAAAVQAPKRRVLHRSASVVCRWVPMRRRAFAEMCGPHICTQLKQTTHHLHTIRCI